MPSQLVYVRHTHSSHHMNHQGPFFSVHPNSILFHLLLPYGSLFVSPAAFFHRLIRTFWPHRSPSHLLRKFMPLPRNFGCFCRLFGLVSGCPTDLLLWFCNSFTFFIDNRGISGFDSIIRFWFRICFGQSIHHSELTALSVHAGGSSKYFQHNECTYGDSHFVERCLQNRMCKKHQRLVVCVRLISISE